MNVSSESLQQAWQRQALDAPRISLEYLRHRTGALRRRTLLRNGIEYVGCVAGIVFVVWAQWHFIVARPMFTSAIFMWIAGIAYIMWQWHRRAGAQQPAAELGTLDALRFYRQELERQRDARRGNWRWWVPALVPCVMATFLSLFMEVQPIPWTPMGLLAAWVVIGVGLGIAGYERAARRYQEEIDALDSLS